MQNPQPYFHRDSSGISKRSLNLFCIISIYHPLHADSRTNTINKLKPDEMKKVQDDVIILKAYSLKELAAIYGIDRRTLKNWLKPFEEEIGKKKGRYYQIPQVKIIFQKLSLPSSITAA